MTLYYPQIARNLDSLGEEQKKYESIKSDILMPYIPIIARLDGKAFHTYTKNLKKPFDIDLQACMKETLTTLCEKYQADLGYSQSDEITLVWYNDNPDKIIFDGRRDKYMSLLASTCSVAFYKATLKYLPNKSDDMPQFDCRVFQVPNNQKVFENILWRWLDARKNSVSMLASSIYSPKELLKKSTKERKEMLKEKGIFWDDYSNDCKYGYFCKKKVYYKKIECPEKFKESIDGGIEFGPDDIRVPRKQYMIVDTPALYILSPTYTPDNLVDGKYENDMRLLHDIFSTQYLGAFN